MRVIGLEHTNPSFTEFAFVPREFGPLEAASGPFGPADRALSRADKTRPTSRPKGRVCASFSRWKRASRAAPAELLLLVQTRLAVVASRGARFAGAGSHSGPVGSGYSSK
jgi:hypothetical protein